MGLAEFLYVILNVIFIVVPIGLTLLAVFFDKIHPSVRDGIISMVLSVIGFALLFYHLFFAKDFTWAYLPGPAFWMIHAFIEFWKVYSHEKRARKEREEQELKQEIPTDFEV